MPTAEDRQARALEELTRHVKQLVGVFTAMNENMVAAIKEFREFIEASKLEYSEEITTETVETQSGWGDKNTLSYQTEITPDKVFDPQKEKKFDG